MKALDANKETRQVQYSSMPGRPESGVQWGVHALWLCPLCAQYQLNRPQLHQLRTSSISSATCHQRFNLHGYIGARKHFYEVTMSESSDHLVHAGCLKWTHSRPFQYEPLCTQEGAFRLLRLHRADDSGQIRCELFNASISQWNGRYTACSYVWGKEVSPELILVNGQPAPVTRNLLDFIQAIRLNMQGLHIILWIDAICIDQSSTPERSRQVQIMGDIFKTAARVYCLLDPATEDSDCLCELPDHEFSSFLAYPRWSLDRPDDLKEQGDKRHDRVCKVMQQLYGLDYWIRVWIIQEYSVAVEVVIYWGTMVMSEARLLSLYSQTAFSMDRSVYKFSELAISFVGYRRRSEWEKEATFEDAYTRFEDSDCAVPRDSIFALMGLLPAVDKKTKASVVDYSTPITTVLLRVLQHFNFERLGRFLHSAIERLDMTPDEMPSRTETQNHILSLDFRHPVEFWRPSSTAQTAHEALIASRHNLLPFQKMIGENAKLGYSALFFEDPKPAVVRHLDGLLQHTTILVDETRSVIKGEYLEGTIVGLGFRVSSDVCYPQVWKEFKLWDLYLHWATCMARVSTVRWLSCQRAVLKIDIPYVFLLALILIEGLIYDEESKHQQYWIRRKVETLAVLTKDLGTRMLHEYEQLRNSQNSSTTRTSKEINAVRKCSDQDDTADSIGVPKRPRQS
jgi:hypothetical protein